MPTSKKISELTSYTTPLNADLVPVVDTANTETKQVSWANIKATLKAYFDTLYHPLFTILTSANGGTGNGFTKFTGPTTTEKTFTLPDSSDTLLGNGTTNTISGVKTFNDGTLKINGATSGSSTLKAPAVASTYVHTLPAATDTLVALATTDTLTNKRITKRVGSETSSSTSTPTADTVDEWNVTALAAADAFAAPTGTPTNGQTLIIRIKDNGTARALTWNAIYRASSELALPTTTTLGKTLYLGFKYNSTDSKWDLLAKLDNFT